MTKEHPPPPQKSLCHSDRLIVINVCIPADPESTQPPSTPSALTEPPATPPVITGYSAGSVLTEGGPLSLTCTVTGGRPLVTAVTLFCSSRPHVSGPSSVNRQRTAVSTTLDIAALRPSDNGSLCVCTATWEGAPQRYNMAATVSLTVILRFTDVLNQLPLPAMA